MLFRSSTGLKIDPDKIKAIENFPKITTKKQLQSFLGLTVFLASFVPFYSHSLFPAFKLLKGKKESKFEMTAEASECIERFKNYIKTETVLYHVDFSKPLYLSTDASNVAVGSFLYQIGIYEKTIEGKQQCLMDLGYIPETNGDAAYLFPGVSPGKNTPLVTTFLQHKQDLKKYDYLNTLSDQIGRAHV